MERLTCAACGHGHFGRRPVLSKELIEAWQLSPEEARYIDEQQGVHCAACGSNLRSIALARAICSALGGRPPLNVLAPSVPASLKILEINEAGDLTQFLQHIPGYRFAAYPDVDMQKMPFFDGEFDLVVHSDTLEHVENPHLGLRECRRILKAVGACCYTVPIVVRRMSRSRAGLPASDHAGHHVHTEFGADAWVVAAAAGFSRVELTSVLFPRAIAIVARA